MSDEPAFRAFTYRAFDGLMLAGRDYGPEQSAFLPVICLPGLTRTSRDFHELALALSRGERARRVIALDYRGRGLSAWDPDPANYSLIIELQDVLDGMADRGIERAVIVGTSRGGILAMSMGGVRPAAMAGVVLNDIGSTIDTAGLLRIKSYVGKDWPLLDWEDAVELLRSNLGSQFPAYEDADWVEQAHLTFADRGGKPVYDYDPALARGLDRLTRDTPPIDLSAPFASLAHMPVLVIRGSETDLFSEATLKAMIAVHPGLNVVHVPGEGHPPMLRGELVSRIVRFVDEIG